MEHSLDNPVTQSLLALGKSKKTKQLILSPARVSSHNPPEPDKDIPRGGLPSSESGLEAGAQNSPQTPAPGSELHPLLPQGPHVQELEQEKLYGRLQLSLSKTTKISVSGFQRVDNKNMSCFTITYLPVHYIWSGIKGNLF